MSDEADPDQKEKNAAIAIFWLMVGLTPIFILLSIVSSPHQNVFTRWVIIFCAACNLAGGIGCLRRIKDIATRIILGILFAGFFFALSWVIAIFQACSHMGSI